jgi:hypothetical protein
MNETLESKPMGFADRIKAAAGVVLTGRRINPLAEEPQEGEAGELVKEWQTRILEAREFWQPVFKRIREEQAFAAGNQWPDSEGSDWFKEKYVGDRIQQMLNRLQAARYAKNPKTQATTRERMSFEFWDESEESLAGARALLAAAQPILDQAAVALNLGKQPLAPPPPEIEMAQKIVADYEQGMAEKALFAKVARTAALLVQQQWDTQTPEFIVQMKQLVTRVDTSRVGYIKVSYRRDEAPLDPMQSAKVVSLKARMTTLKSQLDKIAAGEIEADSAEAEETAILLEAVTKELSAAEKPEFEDEGPVDDFLTATSVIVDPACRCLKEFIGASWICHEMLMPLAEAEAEHGISLFDVGAVLYDDYGPQTRADSRNQKAETAGACKKVCVWHVEDKKTGMCFVLIDGVKHFIKPPYVRLPKVKRYWSIVALTYHVTEVEVNDPKNDVTCYGKSTVRRVMPMQVDINSQGEELRAHRIANRPGKVGVASKFGENDRAKLAAPRSSHDCIMLQDLQPGEKVADYLQPMPTTPLDPALYDTAQSDQAMLLAGGVQSSNMGNQNPGETATGQAIAEGSRISVDDSQTQDLDYCLGIVAQMHWEMSLQEMPLELVKKKVGRGAVFPDLAKDKFATDIFVEIEAGSSGKPNAALEAAKAEKLGPLIIQAMADPRLAFLVKIYARLLDSNIDIDEIMKAGSAGGQMGGQPQPGQPGQAPGPLPPGQPAGNLVPAGQPRPPQLPPQQRAQARASAGV